MDIEKLIKTTLHKELHIIDCGSADHPDYIISGTDNATTELVKIFRQVAVINSTNSIEEIVNCEYFDKGFCVVCNCNDCTGQRCKVYETKKHCNLYISK